MSGLSSSLTNLPILVLVEAAKWERCRWAVLRLEAMLVQDSPLLFAVILVRERLLSGEPKGAKKKATMVALRLSVCGCRITATFQHRSEIGGRLMMAAEKARKTEQAFLTWS